jgi:antitoxin MazE
MRLKLVQIGNSQGIRIPKSLLRQCGMEDEVEVEMENNTLILKPTNINSRAGWDSAFSKMAKEGDDQLLDPELKTEFDQEEWEWK